MSRRSRFTQVLALLLAATLVGCGGGGGKSSTPPANGFGTIALMDIKGSVMLLTRASETSATTSIKVVDQTGSIGWLSWSPNGQKLVCSGGFPQIYSRGGGLVTTLTDNRNFDLVWAPDSMSLLGGSGFGKINRYWLDGRIEVLVDSSSSRNACGQFTSDGKAIVFAHIEAAPYGQSIFRLDVSNQSSEMPSQPICQIDNGNLSVIDLTTLADGSIIVCQEHSLGIIRTPNLSSNANPLEVKDQFDKEAQVVSLSLDKRYLGVLIQNLQGEVTIDSEIRIYDTSSLALTTTIRASELDLPGHPGAIRAFAWSPDNSQLVIDSYDSLLLFRLADRTHSTFYTIDATSRSTPRTKGGFFSPDPTLASHALSWTR